MPDSLEQLKQQWQELNLRVNHLDEANRELTDRLSRGHVTSTQQRLAHATRRWGLFAFTLIPMAFVVYHTMLMPLWLSIVYAAFGLVMGCLVLWLAAYINRERLVDLPVTQAYDRARLIHKLQWQCRGVGIVLGGILVILMLYYLNQDSDSSMLISACVGLVLGAIIGIAKARNHNRMSNRLIKDTRPDNE